MKNQVIYVMEGNRPLLVAACSVGTAKTPTPKGRFTIYSKTQKRRRISNPGSGYPMGYWCEFKSGYGIHAGWVHPAPRTHGCVRLHFNVAPKFFALVKEGTLLYIADTQPEDATIGRNVPRPQDYANPECFAAHPRTPTRFSTFTTGLLTASRVALPECPPETAVPSPPPAKSKTQACTGPHPVRS
ncbi:MAG: L,D-transpeptidase [Verrucomicrobiales bacterium]